MQAVSDEWLMNQQSQVHKQGYCIVTITDHKTSPATVTVISSLTASNKIKSVVHKRTFDPVGIESPTCNLVVTLYNYAGEYASLYKDYDERKIEVEVKYGYRLTVNETIQGGKFIVSNISVNAEKAVVIEGVSRTELLSGQEKTVFNPVDDRDFIIYEASSASSGKETVSVSDFSYRNFKELSLKNLTEQIKLTNDFVIEDTLSLLPNKKLLFPVNYECTTRELLAYICNAVQANAKINRQDALTLTNSSKYEYKNKISRLNMFNVPLYSQSKKLRQIKLESDKYSLSTVIDETYYATNFKEKFLECDYTKYEPYSFRIHGKSIGKITRKTQDGKRGYLISSTSGSNWNSNVGYSLMFRELQTQKVNSEIVYSNLGEICDINNKLLAPSDLSRIKKYFSNRDLYEIELRGDPARDIGDYVRVELENGEYSKGLVISDTLTFDGVFKEKITVRMIRNDFETVTEDISELINGTFRYATSNSGTETNAKVGYGEYGIISGGGYGS